MKLREEEVESNYPRRTANQAIEQKGEQLPQPMVALSLAMLMPCLPGLASCYNRQSMKGLVYFLLGIGVFFLLVPHVGRFTIYSLWSPKSLGVFCHYFIYALDSALVAKRWSEGNSVGPWEMF